MKNNLAIYVYIYELWYTKCIKVIKLYWITYILTLFYSLATNVSFVMRLLNKKKKIIVKIEYINNVNQYYMYI